MKNYCTTIDVSDCIRLDLFTPECFRVRRSTLEKERFPEEYEIPFAVGRTEAWDAVSHIADGSTDSTMMAVQTEKLKIYVRKDTGAFIVEDTNGRRLYPEDAPHYGMFCNHCIVFDSANFWKEETDCSRFAHWFYNPETGLYDICLKEDKLLDIFFIYAPTYKQGYALFNTLVGAEPMLPRKGYGYYQTQHLSGKGNQKLLMETARLLRERDIPCDTLIVDFEWGDGADGGKEVPWGSRLEWSSEYCTPDTPSEMVRKLAEQHFDVMTIHHNVPAYENRFDEDWVCAEYPEELWWEKMQQQLDIGVVGTWQDTRRTDVTNGRIYAGIEKRTQKRVTMLSDYDLYRDSCWTKDCVMTPMKQKIGGRRYPFFWTGDSATANWSDLQYQVKGITNVHGALKGVSYITNDGLRPGSVELGVRADQFLAFNSICRSHSCKPWETPQNATALAEAMAIDKEKTQQLPTQTDEELLGLTNQSEIQESIIRKYLKLRYRLIPYIYTAARQCYDTGLPMTRPLMVEFEDDKNCNANQYPYEYLFGNDILACPVVDEKNKMDIYLPQGCQWVDYWTGKIYNGGEILAVDTTDLSNMPLFVRNGAIIPMQPEKNWIDEENEVLILCVFGNKDGEMVLYEDDGQTMDYQHGKCAFTKITSQVRDGELTVSADLPEGDFVCAESRTIIVEWNGKRQCALWDSTEKLSICLM